MAINKVEFGSDTLLDVTDTTAVASDVALGKRITLASGEKATGTLAFVNYYTGTSDPSAALGNNGDIYLKVVS